VLSFCRDVIALRRERPELAEGDYAPVDTRNGVWSWRRGGTIAVAVNLSPDRVALDLGGRVLLSTSHDADPSALEPWQGVVLDLT
jgi:hypothetical protein